MSGHIREEKIALLAGGELDAREMPELALHLSGCPTCAARVKSFREDRQALATLRESGVGDSDFDHVRRSVMQQLPAERFPHFRMGLLQWGALAAAVLAMAVIGTWYWNRGPAPQRSELSGPAGRTRVELTQPQPVRPAVPLDKTVVNQPRVAKPARILRPPRQQSTAGSSLPATNVAVEFSAAAQKPLVRDDVVIKLETPDPNVVIIWLASPKGAGR